MRKWAEKAMNPLRNSFLMLLILSLMICMVMVSHRAVANVDLFEHQSYDRRLPDKVIRGLEMMDSDLQNAKRLISFDSDRIRFEDRQGSIKEYHFAYGVLWCNNYPVISEITAFHFEFRNASRHLVSPSRMSLPITTIEYTLKILHRDQDLFANQSFNAPRSAETPRATLALLDSRQ